MPETVVIGAGQAGLATSYHLAQRGREHVVLERGLVGETWRSQRWDGFVLNTPNWAQLLPGFHYAGPNPDDFAPRTEVIAYLEAYAQSIPAPVREGVEVTRVRRSGGRFAVETSDGALPGARARVLAPRDRPCGRDDRQPSLPRRALDLQPARARKRRRPRLQSALARTPGATRLGRLEGIEADMVHLGRGLEESLASGDEFVADFKRRVDEHVRATGLDVPEPEDEEAPSPVPLLTELDLRESGVSTILWANGFRPDHSWIEGVDTDEQGWPVHKRGASPVPGLYFVGLHWLHKPKSSLFFGVGEDVEHVARHLDERA